MKKSHALFLLLTFATVALCVYEAMFPLPASTAFINFLGLEAFMLLCVSLLLGPIAVIDRSYAQLTGQRRAIGLSAFILTFGHIFLAAAMQFGWQFPEMFSRLFIQLAIPAALIFVVLTVTSSDYAIRRLGPKTWKGVQKLNYIAFVLSFAHFLLAARGLFVPVSNLVFVNIAEVFAILLGVAVIILQACGFAMRRANEKKRLNASGGPA